MSIMTKLFCIDYLYFIDYILYSNYVFLGLDEVCSVSVFLL